MSGIASVLEQIKERKPTDEELQRIYKISNALGMNDNDVFMSLIAALDHYHGLYDAIPSSINEATRKASLEAVERAKAAISEMVAEKERNLSEAVYLSAEKVAEASSTKVMLKWISTAMIACTLCLCAVSWFSYNQGKKSGFSMARDEDLFLKTRDAWAQTESYRNAFLYYQKGLLDPILKCNQKGWKIENGFCYPHEFIDEKGKKWVFGWKIP